MKYLEEKNFLSNIFSMAFDKFYNKSSMTTMAKSEFDIVTDIDLKIEDFLISEINKNYPNDTILSEERNSKQRLGIRTWVLDPIDGTFNMSRNRPYFGIQGA